jgi:hypothetical protein
VPHDHDEIVLEVAGYVPPHSSFTFRPIPISPGMA